MTDFILAFVVTVVIGKYVSAKLPGTPIDPVIFFIPFILYEPLFTAHLATLGQLIFRFRVRRLDNKQKIPLWRAYGRYFVKGSLGIISLLTIPARQDRRAIHDLATGTIVIEQNNA